MLKFMFAFLVWVLASGFSLADDYGSKSCRCLAFQKCWPDTQTWARLNASVDGRLIKVLPPAAPCHDPYYDAQACQEATDKWNYPFWRPDQAGAMQAPNWEMLGEDRCLISSSRNSTCSQAAVPVYAVNVSDVTHVQSAVRFARKYNLRLVIKNTGHDYFGKSTAAGSLSIWLHHLKEKKFHDVFVPKDCPHIQSRPGTAVTIGAGVQFEELYQATFEHQSVIVGAGCSSVGAAGGYPQGAGHSPISPAFGLAADNILQYEVVTSKGELLVANECQNQDLFWALRGGGGGTYGVVVSATHKTHPAFQSLHFTSYTITAKSKSGLLDLIVKFTETSPSLSDDGWSGYFTFSNRTLSLPHLLPNKNTSFAEKSLSPLLTFARTHPELQVSGSLLQFDSFQEWHLQIQCGGQPSCVNTNVSSLVGAPILIASRLFPREIVDKSPKQVSEAFLKLLEEHHTSVSGVHVGGAVAKNWGNAVNPVWRRAIWLVLHGLNFPEDATQAQQKEVARRITAANKLLIDITPGSGAYLNEADYNEPDWQHSFYGEHYERLYKIKQKFDPSGLFVCHHCVGSEDWSEDLNCKRK